MDSTHRVLEPDDQAESSVDTVQRAAQAPDQFVPHRDRRAFGNVKLRLEA